MHRRPIFISYARDTHARQAVAVHHVLGANTAFLDTSDIDTGDRFPEAIVEALLESRVVIAFLDDAYFSRWYCLRELRTVLVPYDALLRHPGITDAQLDESLQHIVIARSATSDKALANLPPILRSTQWPEDTRCQAIADEALRRLTLFPSKLKDRLQGPAFDLIRQTILEESALPPVANLSGMRIYHPQGQIDSSLGERFVGRANDLARLHFELSVMRGNPVKSAALSTRMVAAGGFGKTRMATEFIWRYCRAYYPGGVFWINADVNAATLEEQFYCILRTLGSEGQISPLSELRERKEDIRSKLRNALAMQPSNEPILMVIDNIPESAEGKSAPGLDVFCPALGLVTVLATSRQKVLEHGTREVILDTLPRSASILLLNSGLEETETLSYEDSNRVAELVGDLPFALDLINRLIASRAIPASAMLKRIQHTSITEEIDEAYRVLRGQVADSALRGVTQVLAMSLEKLELAARKMAFVLAELAPKEVPDRLVDKIGDGANLPRIRTMLRNRHFVTGGHPGTLGEMHRVLADFLRTREESRSGGYFESACRSMRMALDSSSPDFDWHVDQALWEHHAFLLRRWLSMHRGGSIVKRQLPLLHVSDIRSFSAILEGGAIEPAPAVTGERIIYCAYGGVSFRRSDTPARNASFFPVVFALDSNRISEQPRVGMSGQHPMTDLGVSVRDVVMALWGSNLNYVTGAVRPEAVPQALLGSRSMGYERWMIECTFRRPVVLAQSLVWTAIPDELRPEVARRWPALKAGAPWFTYDTFRASRPSEILAVIDHAFHNDVLPKYLGN